MISIGLRASHKITTILAIQLIVGILNANAVEIDAEIERGEDLLKKKGCIGCHSTDGSARVGPTFARMWGNQLKVLRDGVPGEIRVDRDALIQSTGFPETVLVEGYPAGVMPPTELDEDELGAAQKYLESLAGTEQTGPAGQYAMISVLLAAITFALLHLFLSSHRVRTPVIAKVGENPFLGIYSLLVAVALTWLIWAWIDAPFVPLWAPLRWTRWIPLLVMPFSMILMVAGLTLKNPASVGQESQLDEADAVSGILKITRHPVLWGQGLWALSHIPSNGDLASLFFFTSFAFLCFAGMIHIDQRRKLAFGERWDAFAARASLLPFASVLRGVTSVSLKDIGYINILISLLIYAGFFHLHVWIIGVSPMPEVAKKRIAVAHDPQSLLARCCSSIC